MIWDTDIDFFLLPEGKKRTENFCSGFLASLKSSLNGSDRFLSYPMTRKERENLISTSSESQTFAQPFGLIGAFFLMKS